MPTPLPTSPLEEIAKLQLKIEELKHTAIDELKNRRAELGRELTEVIAELAALTGKPPRAARVPRAAKLAESAEVFGAPAPAAPQPRRTRAPRVAPLQVDSAEYDDLALRVRKFLAVSGEGKNGKEIAEHLLMSSPNQRNRLKPLLADIRHFKRTGEGVSTRYFLR